MRGIFPLPCPSPDVEASKTEASILWNPRGTLGRAHLDPIHRMQRSGRAPSPSCPQPAAGTNGRHLAPASSCRPCPRYGPTL
jgi:hypothetical protein